MIAETNDSPFPHKLVDAIAQRGTEVRVGRWFELEAAVAGIADAGAAWRFRAPLQGWKAI
jgi:hypothetical protein